MTDSVRHRHALSLTLIRMAELVTVAAVFSLCATQAATQTVASATGASATQGQAGKANSNQAQANAAPNNPRDVLYPGDIVRLKIYREPDLSGDYEVNERGMAVFPKVGQIQVTQMTTDSLQRLLISTYSTYLRDPAIEVTPLRRVTVLGAVKNPGLYPVDPTMSIADALALAGGPTADGNQKKLELIRNGKKQNVTITVREQVVDTPVRSGDELYVPERSWLSRNGYIVGAAIGAAAVITTTIITHY